MVRWAVGLRSLECTEQQVLAALNEGKILRTHVLRPTWHLVVAEDIYWLLDLTGERIKTKLKGRHRQLELNAKFVAKSQTALEKVLSEKPWLTRDEIKTAFMQRKIPVDNNRLSHLLVLAELDQLICSGPVHNNQHTYALLEKRVPVKSRRSRDEALAELTRRYFTSHGPATVKDFAWWSGLTLTDIQEGIALNGKKLVSETIDNSVFCSVFFI